MSGYIHSVLNLLPALGGSLAMTGVSLGVGLPLGFLAGLALARGPLILRVVTTVLMEIFRGFPALLTLYLVYFGLASVVALDTFTSVCVAFSITSAAYSAEIFRASITSVPRGQREAAFALGLPPARTVLLVVVPHVIRIAVPPIIGIAILVFQGTSLAYAIGAKELLGAAFSIGLNTYSLLPQLLLASALYLIVTIGFTGIERAARRYAARVSGTVSRRPRVLDLVPS